MDTTLSTTGSKIISTKPLYRGDLINNDACYWPRPDYSKKEWKMVQTGAEGLTYDASRFNSFYKQRMVVCSMSGGYPGYRLAEKNPHKILEGSRRFYQPGSDEDFMTIQNLSGALGAQIVADEIFAKNGLKNQALCEWMATNTMKDFYIVGPDDQEAVLRAIHSIHAISQGNPWTDGIFEKACWGPKVWLDHDGIVYTNDHAWSRNGSNEKGVGLASQYGANIVLEYREGKPHDVVDIMDRPVSVVDQAWEDFRHIVFETERGFRTETAAALLISRFMHDEMWQQDMPYINKERAHDTVKAHYASPAEMEKMEQLKAMALPYLAERCNWPTLQSILDEEAHFEGMNMRVYWDNFVEPSRPQLKLIQDIEKTTLSYLPRGGFDAAEIAKLVEERKDKPERRVAMATAAAKSKPRVKGLHEDAFDAKFDPKIFNDRNFQRLGGTHNPDSNPDNDHLNFDQASAIMVVNAARIARRPVNGSKTYLYLDDPKGGLMGASFEQKNNITDSRSVSAQFDPLAQGSKTFAEDIASDHSLHMQSATIALMRDENFADWRAHNDLGNIVTLTDFKKAGAKFSSRRESMDAEMRQGIAADGGLEMSPEAIETCVRRFVSLAGDGIIYNPGKIDDMSARVIGEAVNVVMGQTPRPHSGGKYKQDFYRHDDYLKSAKDGNPPSGRDLGDLILDIGMQVKANLESKSPDEMKGQIITLARLMTYYEMVMDSGRCNYETIRGDKIGEDHVEKIVNLTEADEEFWIELLEYDPATPLLEDMDVHKVGTNSMLDAFLEQPEFEAFCTPENEKSGAYYSHYAADPARKARLVQMMWAWMCAMPVYSQDNPKTSAKAMPVTGMLKTKGMVGMDDFSLRDLDITYKKGRDHMDGQTEFYQKNTFGKGRLFIDGPALSRA